tara:strand:- start:336 stop:746 length:411 start_codon:yes stop_codon:yes gene_type:complete
MFKNRLVLTIVFIVFSQNSYADSTSNSLSLSLPNSGMNYQSDKFRAGDLDCSHSIGSATNFEFGLTSIIQGSSLANAGHRTGDIGLYAQITIPLGKRNKNRIDCSRLYELELTKKRLEVMRLEQEIKQLRALAFEN